MADLRAAIYGSRQDGQAKVCLALARSLGIECVGFLDDVAGHPAEALGLPPLGGVEQLTDLGSKGIDAVVLGFGDGQGRHALVAPIRAAGLALPTLVHPDARVDASATLADGVVVLRGAMVGEDVRVGEAALVNMGALLTHDVVVGAGASIGPGAVLAGRSRVGAGADLGAGAVLLPDARVGDNATVGAGAVVTGSVDPGATVVGVPASPL